MKKIFHFAALALIASALTVACGGNNEGDDTTKNDSNDSTLVNVEDSTLDTTLDTAVADTVDITVPETQATKKAGKKADKNAKTASKDTPTDVNSNAQSRLTQKQVEKTGIKEATPAKNAPATNTDPNQNAANRLKK